MLNLEDVRAIKILNKQKCKLMLCSKYAVTDAYFPKDFMRELDRRFVQCNQHYFINLEHFDHIDRKKNAAVMDDGLEIPLSFPGNCKLLLSFFLYKKMKNKY